MIHTRYLCKVYNVLIIFQQSFFVLIFIYLYKHCHGHLSDYVFSFQTHLTLQVCLFMLTHFDEKLVENAKCWPQILVRNESVVQHSFFRSVPFMNLLWLLFKMLVVVWYAYVLNIPGNLVKFSSVITPYFLSFSIKVSDKYMYIVY